MLPSSSSSSSARVVLGALAAVVLGACGLSLFVDGASNEVDGGIVVTPDAAPTGDPDATPPPPPDGEAPPDAAPDTGPPPIRDAGTAIDALPPAAADCTTVVLSETFDGNDAGALGLVGSARVANGRLELVPEEARLDVRGAAYVNLPQPLGHYRAKLVVSTNALSAPYLRSDGLAFMVLEKPVPANPALGSGNDLGMTNAPAGQHGYGVILDIYPPSGQPRYVGSNELGPASNNLRAVTELQSFSASNATSFAITVLNLGDGNTYYEVRSRFGEDRHAIPYRTGYPTDPSFSTLFFSASAGAAFAPGFFVDDVLVTSCP